MNFLIPFVYTQFSVDYAWNTDVKVIGRCPSWMEPGVDDSLGRALPIFKVTIRRPTLNISVVAERIGFWRRP
jgi:hypothetical protein